MQNKEDLIFIQQVIDLTTVVIPSNIEICVHSAKTEDTAKKEYHVLFLRDGQPVLVKKSTIKPPSENDTPRTKTLAKMEDMPLEFQIANALNLFFSDTDSRPYTESKTLMCLTPKEVETFFPQGLTEEHIRSQYPELQESKIYIYPLKNGHYRITEIPTLRGQLTSQSIDALGLSAPVAEALKSEITAFHSFKAAYLAELSKGLFSHSNVDFKKVKHMGHVRAITEGEENKHRRATRVINDSPLKELLAESKENNSQLGVTHNH